MVKSYIILKKNGQKIFCQNPNSSNKPNWEDRNIPIEDAQMHLKWYQSGWPDNHYEIYHDIVEHEK